MQVLATLVAGLLFGLGLSFAGLVNPAKVLAFLDIAGDWDPSLAVTMACAVGLTFLGYRLAFARGAPLFADTFQVPVLADIDRRLVSGAALFGIGWGLVGFCPGPAIAALSLGLQPAFVFVAAMLAGMALARLSGRRAPAAKQVKAT